jgi:uncharacterized protein YozE (UPF0346 family)
METRQVKNFVPCKLDLDFVFKNYIEIVGEICRLIPAYLDGFENHLHDELSQSFELVGLQTSIKNPDILRPRQYCDKVDYYFDFVMRDSLFPRHLFSAEVVCYLEENDDFSLKKGISDFQVGSIIITDSNYDLTREITSYRAIEF